MTIFVFNLMLGSTLAISSSIGVYNNTWRVINNQSLTPIKRVALNALLTYSAALLSLSLLKFVVSTSIPILASILVMAPGFGLKFFLDYKKLWAIANPPPPPNLAPLNQAIARCTTAAQYIKPDYDKLEDLHNDAKTIQGYDFKEIAEIQDKVNNFKLKLFGFDKVYKDYTDIRTKLHKEHPHQNFKTCSKDVEDIALLSETLKSDDWNGSVGHALFTGHFIYHEKEKNRSKDFTKIEQLFREGKFKDALLLADSK